MRYVMASLAVLVSLCLVLPAGAGPSSGRGKGTMQKKSKRAVTLSITAEPDAGVTVGGSYKGRTPLTLKVSPGPKRVTLETRDGQREVRSINGKPGEALTIHHSFRKAAARGSDAAVEEGTGKKTPYLEALKRQNLGVISVSSSVPGRLFVDGNDTTRVTPITDLETTAGQHRLKLMFVTGGEKEVDVQVTSGKRSQVSITP